MLKNKKFTSDVNRFELIEYIFAQRLCNCTGKNIPRKDFKPTAEHSTPDIPWKDTPPIS